MKEFEPCIYKDWCRKRQEKMLKNEYCAIVDKKVDCQNGLVKVREERHERKI